MAETGAPSLLERLGLHRPELRAWAMYDWANSAVVTTMIAAVFPAYFSHVAAADFERDHQRPTSPATSGARLGGEGPEAPS